MKTHQTKKTPRVLCAFRLPVEIKAEIKQHAKETGLSEADVIVHALQLFPSAAALKVAFDSAPQPGRWKIPAKPPGAKIEIPVGSTPSKAGLIVATDAKGAIRRRLKGWGMKASEAQIDTAAKFNAAVDFAAGPDKEVRTLVHSDALIRLPSRLGRKPILRPGEKHERK